MKSTPAPASITHHSVAIDALDGPDGASVDSDPAQPDKVARLAAWTITRKPLPCRFEYRL